MAECGSEEIDYTEASRPTLRLRQVVKFASRRIPLANRLSLFESNSPRSRSKGGDDMRLRGELDR